VKNGLNVFDIGNEEIDEFDLADFRLDVDQVLILDLIDDPLLLLSKLGSSYSIGSLRTHMYLFFVM
jgi:hypothetical protein